MFDPDLYKDIFCTKIFLAQEYQRMQKCILETLYFYPGAFVHMGICAYLNTMKKIITVYSLKVFLNLDEKGAILPLLLLSLIPNFVNQILDVVENRCLYTYIGGNLESMFL